MIYCCTVSNILYTRHIQYYTINYTTLYAYISVYTCIVCNIENYGKDNRTRGNAHNPSARYAPQTDYLHNIVPPSHLPVIPHQGKINSTLLHSAYMCAAGGMFCLRLANIISMHSPCSSFNIDANRPVHFSFSSW